MEQPNQSQATQRKGTHTHANANACAHALLGEKNNLDPLDNPLDNPLDYPPENPRDNDGNTNTQANAHAHVHANAHVHGFHSCAHVHAHVHAHDHAHVHANVHTSSGKNNSGPPDNPPDNDGKLDYVYHLNVHNIAVNHLKSLIDYDYEDETHAHVLVKHDVVMNAQAHKTNVFQILLNGYIIFDVSNTYGQGPMSNRDQWRHHWMILPKEPYRTAE